MTRVVIALSRASRSVLHDEGQAMNSEGEAQQFAASTHPIQQGPCLCIRWMVRLSMSLCVPLAVEGSMFNAPAGRAADLDEPSVDVFTVIPSGTAC